MAPAINQLTDAQRDCLRLVLSHHNSKEIAGILGVSPSAVDKRIERAVQVLQVSSRFAAARMLARDEAPDGMGAITATVPSAAFAETDTPVDTATPSPHATSDWLPSEPIDIPITPESVASELATGPRWLVRRLLGLSPTSGFSGMARNQFSKLQRLGLILGLILFVSVTSMTLLNLAMTLSSFLTTHRIDLSR